MFRSPTTSVQPLPRTVELGRSKESVKEIGPGTGVGVTVGVLVGAGGVGVFVGVLVCGAGPVGIFVGVGVGVGVFAGGAVGVLVGVGVGVIPGDVTAMQAENSDVSPVDRRVAVAVAAAPAATEAGNVTEKAACPAPSVVTSVEPMNAAP